jgi:hypothetical protein
MEKANHVTVKNDYYSSLRFPNVPDHHLFLLLSATFSIVSKIEIVMMLSIQEERMSNLVRSRLFDQDWRGPQINLKSKDRDRLTKLLRNAFENASHRGTLFQLTAVQWYRN